ncbi:GNAT family N-acetyltransferase [Candidatus Bathyarchaeota archaeon]|nr:GNAT family N-acetyltransferase [Candidatus Bathyarchaeota archaeon]
MITFHTLTPEDQGFFLGLIDMVGWGLTGADYRRMLTFSPGGMFKAVSGGEDVGVVVTVPYGEMGWVGNLIVVPESRGVGVGEALMRRSVEHLESLGVKAIRLDAVPKAIPLYRRLGFREEYPSLRFTGTAAVNPVSLTRPMTAGDLDEVSALDRRFFKGDRAHMLGYVYETFPDLCYTARSGGSLVGYIMAKDGSDSVKVGPWICVPGYAEAAVQLLWSVMNRRPGEKMWVGCPEGNTSSLAILKRNGFTSLPSSLRMCLGSCGVCEDVAGVFGLGGPDKG